MTEFIKYRFIIARRTSLLEPIFLLFLLLPISHTDAQSAKGTLSSEVEAFFDMIYGADQRLISGSYYFNPPQGSIEGDPYHISEEWKNGSVRINGMLYENLDLKYDIERNNIILNFSNINGSNYHIVLRRTLISEFTMDGRKFIPYPGSNKVDTLRFCEVIERGEVNYIVLKSKTLQVSSIAAIKDYVYKENIKQMLYIDDTLIPFRSKKSLYKLYPQYKQDIRKYLRSARIYPRKSRIEDRATMIRYCNELLNME